ncbi:adult cuticle protein 1-like [Eupeodes corollae]|uniref:adult cuticle protein 1-like n=1 Tax=Eupeodes corollae TaxID=290404 RepID=UPI00248F6D72|nr:adult cuticle protein 1-like [Eupeodes corollae]
MKFAIVAVVLALALGAQGSVIPWGLGLGLGSTLDIAGHGLSYTAVSGPALVPQVISPWGLPAAVAVGHAPAAVAIDPHVVPGGSYVAQTRGATHVAPLAGHINSVSSVNVAPAPGTW